MSTDPHGWLCPACGRRVPPRVESCRCGQDRRTALESQQGKRVAPVVRMASVALGYTPGAAPPLKWRTPATVGLAVGAVLTLLATAWALQGDRVVTSQDVRVLAWLDDYTRRSDSGVANTIPAFLALPGQLGAVAAGPPDSSRQGDYPAVHALNAVDLEGFCTSSLPKLVRQEFPGIYDKYSDGELEEKVLDTHPEYRDKLCVMPAWLPRPGEIIKYELKPQALLAFSLGGLLWGLLGAVGFVVVALNAYYRLFVPVLVDSEA